MLRVRVPICGSQWPSGLRRGSTVLAYWDCGFESRRGHGCLCCVCCTVRTKGTDRTIRTNQYRQSTEREKNSPGALMSASCECRVLSGRGLCEGLIVSPEESYRLWCVTLCHPEIASMRRPWPALGCCATETTRNSTLRSVQKVRVQTGTCSVGHDSVLNVTLAKGGCRGWR